MDGHDALRFMKKAAKAWSRRAATTQRNTVTG
jgi:hypothetical protein